MERKTTPKKDILGYLATLPIVLAILSLLGELILQTTFVVEEGVFSVPYGSGLLFSGAGITLFSLVGGGMEQAQGFTAAVNIVLSLAFIFLSSYAIKGKKICFLLPFLLYAADTILSLVFIPLALLDTFPVTLSIFDVVINFLIHLAGLAGLGFSVLRLYFPRKDLTNDGTESH